MDMPDNLRGKPALRLAIGFLQAFLSDPSHAPGERIAPARRLAAAAGVSFTTMCNALRAMMDTGILTMSGGRIYRLASKPDIPVPNPPARITKPHANKRHAVAQRIADDIRAGVFRKGTALPTLSELQGRYRIAYRTMKKALLQLVTENVLEQLPNGSFGVPSFEAGAHTARVVCFVPSYDSFSFAFGQHSEQIFREFELHCAHANIEIDLNFVFWDGQAERYRFRHRKTGRILDREDLDWLHDDSVLGYVYLYTMMGTPFDKQADELTLARCLRKKRPVCLFDENDHLKLPPQLCASPHFRTYAAAVSPIPGRETGRRLLALGHRRIAFISTYPVYRWSQCRLEGLRSAFNDAGFPDAVLPFVADWHEWQEAGARRSNMGALQNHYRRWLSRVPEACRGDYDRAFEKLRWDASGDAEIHLALLPLMEQALADTRITAWAVVNDYLTTFVLRFLKEKRIRIPADLSIISFDDSQDALRDDFSSYNFNHQAIAAAMLGFILQKKPYCTKDAVVPGFIMDRGTIGRARKTE